MYYSLSVKNDCTGNRGWSGKYKLWGWLGWGINCGSEKERSPSSWTSYWVKKER